MSGKLKSHPLNGVHTAGIFADMTGDGPIIGTMVAIVDRAKNLPNRKTIGKQDPYCAARLGKEAKKTTTDIRGGQTPKWDQELRFTVHDSPDYYQLKVSVFTDDKKTDLIGESWIDLRGIIVPGGGQSDIWQTLSCKGKYAGEIRIEITYYDQRPKDKLVAKPKPVSSDQDQGSMRNKTPVKRRPLPIDPVTGEAPPQAPSGPDYSTPPRAHARQTSHSAYIPNQSPLQAVEYNTPPSHAHRAPALESSPASRGALEYSTPPREVPRGARQSMNSYEASPRHADDRNYSPRYPAHQAEQLEQRDHYSPIRESIEAPPADDYRQLPPIEDDRPPPPPVHRSRHNSGGQELVARGSFDASPPKMPHMRHDVLRNEAHRHTSPSYPGRPTFREYDSTVSRHNSYDANYDPEFRSLQPTVEDVPDATSPTQAPYRRNTRLQEQDELFDKVPSPAPLNLSRSPGASPFREEYSASPGYKDPNSYQVAVSPSHGRGYSQSPEHGSYAPHEDQRALVHVKSSPNFPPQELPPSLVPGLDPTLSQEVTEGIYEDRRRDRRQHSQSMVMSTPPRGRPMDSRQSYVPPQDDYAYSQDHSPSYALQKYDQRAITYSGGQESQMVHRRSVSPNPPRQYSAGPESYALQRRSVSPNPRQYSGEQESQIVSRRSVSPYARTSPNPQQAIRRKSVSPAPPIDENRRHSAIPFGPDSYDALNPSSAPPPGYSDPEAKIITHDGREIDPSDHLPMDTWAPEPEKKNEPPAETRSRPQLTGAQPLPPSTRRNPRAGRHSVSAVPTYAPIDDPHTPPGSGGRTRLQKRNYRASMGPAHAGSSPLAPISPDNYQDRQYTPTRSQPRSGGWDHQNENHAPMYGGPPIPAKIPLPLMSGANGSGHELALMQEMQRIDIGTGRSRRRGGGY